jgi:hypothetical protein
MTARFEPGARVEVRYPQTPAEQAGPDSGWPCLPGTVMEQCGPDEWRVRVDVRELATLEDGSQPPPGAPDEDLWFPVCFRGHTEIRPAAS